MSSDWLLLLDFDGTLSPITKIPQEAKLPPETKKLLQKLSKKPGIYLAIISGRTLDDIKIRVGIPDIIYGGNHGLEEEFFGEKYSFPIPDKMRRTLITIKEQLNQIATKFNGLLIEDKGLTLSLHYRLAEEPQIPEIKLLINQILKPFITGGLVSVRPGAKVINIIPNVQWNKGDFAALIIKKIKLYKNKRPIVIAIGDDRTDEDIFQELNSSITVTIGKKENSNAKYHLNGPKDTAIFLKMLNSLV